jgi:hypothetical protein
MASACPCLDEQGMLDAIPECLAITSRFGSDAKTAGGAVFWTTSMSWLVDARTGPDTTSDKIGLIGLQAGNRTQGSY